MCSVVLHTEQIPPRAAQSFHSRPFQSLCVLQLFRVLLINWLIFLASDTQVTFISVTNVQTALVRQRYFLKEYLRHL